MKAISLFSGMGGDTLGMKNAGIDVVAYSEKESKFRETHDKNFEGCELIGNGNILETRDDEFEKYKNHVDMIFAGFPCQGFSQAGKKLPNDPRNTLFKEFLRATRIINPKYIIGENVKGLLTRKNENEELFIDIIKSEFKKLGYRIEPKVMKCNLYGIPQNRQRLIIVGVREDIALEYGNYNFPEESPNNTNISDIIQFSMEGVVKIEEEDFDMTSIPDECIIKNMDNDQTEANSEDKVNGPHPNLVLLAKRRDYEYKGVLYPNRLNFGKRIPVGGEIVDIRKPINTIICTYARQPRFFVPQQNKNGYYIRCLHPVELQQIQGFPKDFDICGDTKCQIVQIGNAVPPPLITQIVYNLPGITDI